MTRYIVDTVFLNGPTPASFLIYFQSFQPNNTIFTTNQFEKMSCRSSILSRDLNPQPLEHESSPITTRPGQFKLETFRGWVPSRGEN